MYNIYKPDKVFQVLPLREKKYVSHIYWIIYVRFYNLRILINLILLLLNL